MDEIYAKPPKTNYATNKTAISESDDAWSLDVLDLNEYGLEKIQKIDML